MIVSSARLALNAKLLLLALSFVPVACAEVSHAPGEQSSGLIAELSPVLRKGPGWVEFEVTVKNTSSEKICALDWGDDWAPVGYVDQTQKWELLMESLYLGVGFPEDGWPNLPPNDWVALNPGSVLTDKIVAKEYPGSYNPLSGKDEDQRPEIEYKRGDVIYARAEITSTRCIDSFRMGKWDPTRTYDFTYSNLSGPFSFP